MTERQNKIHHTSCRHIHKYIIHVTLLHTAMKDVYKKRWCTGVQLNSVLIKNLDKTLGETSCDTLIQITWPDDQWQKYTVRFWDKCPIEFW